MLSKAPKKENCIEQQKGEKMLRDYLVERIEDKYILNTVEYESIEKVAEQLKDVPVEKLACRGLSIDDYFVLFKEKEGEDDV